MKQMLRVRDLSKSFIVRGRAVHVLSRISFDVRAGECVAVVGRSGVGKSTLVSLVAGYQLPDSGEVTCGECAVMGPGPDRIVLAQHDTLLPWFTVRRNAHYAGQVGHLSADRSAACQRADDLLKQFGLWSHRGKFPKTLSGGERRRVELARVFSVRPSVLLLDEPYAGLDEATREELWRHLLSWRMELPTAVVLVTHDLEEACVVADRVLVLGGSPAVIVADETTAAVNEGADDEMSDHVARAVERLRCHLVHLPQLSDESERGH